MFKAWTSSAQDGESLARHLEAHLNEHAHEVLSVSYAVAREHHVLAVYRPIEPMDPEQTEAAVSAAETIIDQAQG